MSGFVHQHGRKTIAFSDHALDRWWERCEENGLHGRQAAMDLLRERLTEAAVKPRRTLMTLPPPWLRISRYHQARAEGYLSLGEDACFVINRNESGDLVAVTYMTRPKTTEGIKA